jgi:16S rRNA processing protein RimM
VPERLVVGEVGKPHGLAGEVYVVPISDDPQRFSPGARLVHDSGRSLVIESTRTHRTRFLVKFEGIDSRDTAENLKGALYVDPDQLRDLEADEYWDHELIGLQVELGDGTAVGSATDVLHGPAQDLLVIDTKVGERLVPMVPGIVVAVDREGRKIVIDPPEGLLD